MKNYRILGTASLFVASALGSAIAQNTPQQTPTPATSAPASMSPDNAGSYATGKPLEMQSKEGFWGHINPLARKKWVTRQVQPIRDRTNELDRFAEFRYIIRERGQDSGAPRSGLHSASRHRDNDDAVAVANDVARRRPRGWGCREDGVCVEDRVS